MGEQLDIYGLISAHKFDQLISYLSDEVLVDQSICII